MLWKIWFNRLPSKTFILHRILNEKFKSEGINAEYVNFEIPQINDFMEVIEENPNLRGLNVTIPYKEQVIPFLNELDPDTAK